MPAQGKTDGTDHLCTTRKVVPRRVKIIFLNTCKICQNRQLFIFLLSCFLNTGESLHVYRSGNRLVLIGKFIRILRGIAFIAALTMKTRNKITFSVIFRKERHNHGMYLFSKRKQRERNTITDCTVTKTHPIEVYKRKFICKNINYCPYSSETVNQS